VDWIRMEKLVDAFLLMDSNVDMNMNIGRDA
jgi:hypothetical protein